MLRAELRSRLRAPALCPSPPLLVGPPPFLYRLASMRVKASLSPGRRLVSPTGDQPVLSAARQPDGLSEQARVPLCPRRMKAPRWDPGLRGGGRSADDSWRFAVMGTGCGVGSGWRNVERERATESHPLNTRVRAWHPNCV